MDQYKLHNPLLFILKMETIPQKDIMQKFFVLGSTRRRALE